jgi:hypothetical protein
VTCTPGDDEPAWLAQLPGGHEPGDWGSVAFDTKGRAWRGKTRGDPRRPKAARQKRGSLQPKTGPSNRLPCGNPRANNAGPGVPRSGSSYDPNRVHADTGLGVRVADPSLEVQGPFPGVSPPPQIPRSTLSDRPSSRAPAYVTPRCRFGDGSVPSLSVVALSARCALQALPALSRRLSLSAPPPVVEKRQRRGGDHAS